MEKNTSTHLASDVKHSPSPSLFENTRIISIRAKQIRLKRRIEREDQLAEVEKHGDSPMDSIYDTSAQEKLAKLYEQRPKPIIVAIKDTQGGNLRYSYPQSDI